MDMRVHADVVATGMRQNQHQVGSLPANTGQRQQLLHRRRHAAAEALHDLPARLLHVPRLHPIETDRIDQLLDRRHGEGGHRLRRPRDPEQSRRRGVRHRIPRLRRQHGRNQDLEWVLAAVSADLLDCRLLHPAYRAGQGPEDGADGLHGFRLIRVRVECRSVAVALAVAAVLARDRRLDDTRVGDVHEAHIQPVTGMLRRAGRHRMVRWTGDRNRCGRPTEMTRYRVTNQRTQLTVVHRAPSLRPRYQ